MTDIKSNNIKPRQVRDLLLLTPQIRKSDASNVTGICNVCDKTFFNILTENEKEEYINSYSDTEIINKMLTHCLNDSVKCIKTEDMVYSKIFKEIWGNEEDDIWDEEDPYIIKGDDDMTDDTNRLSPKDEKEEDIINCDIINQELEEGLYDEYKQWHGR